jgi:hypothetical protein
MSMFDHRLGSVAMWQLMLECGIYLLNMIVVGGLAWHGFRQSEAIKSLRDQIIDLEVENIHLQNELNHQSGLVWNRLSEAEKDAAIRMG